MLVVDAANFITTVSKCFVINYILDHYADKNLTSSLNIYAVGRLGDEYFTF